MSLPGTVTMTSIYLRAEGKTFEVRMIHGKVLDIQDVTDVIAWPRPDYPAWLQRERIMTDEECRELVLHD